ncbi:hypothetical protein [Ralstonia phage RSF1]|uniref:Uncharacterized protein n=1 Tax=Ralstonia phage RSF1 TaxID=1689679 RepID=A0A0K2QQZ3_9CAUD|nr:hypothetical protein AVU11_gp210 [Ralstonia phage RSF1]BAS05002.1 hypothetical protein [Ralstonia phage RSF1]
MSQNQNAAVLADSNADSILVVRVHDSDVEASMKSNYDQGRDKIAGLNNLFAVGCMHADYEITAKLPTEEVSNSTGYFDPLASATFVCHDGETVVAGKTVRFLDERTHRRLYIIVVVPGMNVIIHDRYSFTENGFAGVLACTSDVSGAREFIGMEPVWSEGCQYDFVMACRLFGFEYDRSKNEVYMPRERKQNFFVSMQSFFFNATQRYSKKQEMLNK